MTKTYRPTPQTAGPLYGRKDLNTSVFHWHSKSQGMNSVPLCSLYENSVLWWNPGPQCFEHLREGSEAYIGIVRMDIWLKTGRGLTPSQEGSIHSLPRRGTKHYCGLIPFHYTHSHSKTHKLICHFHHTPTLVACLMDFIQQVPLLSGF